MPEESAADVDVTKAILASSTRICSHMNKDHPQSVLGMALMLWPDTRRAAMLRLSPDAVLLFAVGKGGARKELTWTLDPPLSTPGDARPRLIEIHNVALAPRFDVQLSCFLTFLMILLFGAAYSPWEGFDAVRSVGLAVFRSKRAIVGIAQSCVAIHAVEAAYAFHLARSKLKLTAVSVAGWTVGTFAVGIGCLARLRQLANAKPLEVALKK